MMDEWDTDHVIHERSRLQHSYLLGYSLHRKTRKAYCLTLDWVHQCCPTAVLHIHPRPCLNKHGYLILISWYRTGYRWSPVRTLPVAPSWCDLGRCPRRVVVIKLRRTSALHWNTSQRMMWWSCAVFVVLQQDWDTREPIVVHLVAATLPVTSKRREIRQYRRKGDVSCSHNLRMSLWNLLIP